MALSALVLAQQSRDNVLARLFSWKPLVVIGTFSYSVYLIHAPLLQLLWQYVIRPVGLEKESMLLVFLTAGLGAVIAGAYLFFRVFEQPFLRSGPRPVTSPVGVT